MKTITLRGTEERFRALKYKGFVKEVEIRVYVIDTFNSQKQDWSNLTDEEFITIAEEDGNIYTIQGFQEAFNLGDINTDIDVIRFISVPLL